MKCIIVSHTHWDREWYRTYQQFRARLVDTIDRVLELLDADPGFHFLLDGQTIVLEDYFEIRPERRADLERACRAGRLAIGPWYVQPDSLLPSGEAHVRNLREGRRVGRAVGPVSSVAYTPDSFGHPAQFPQLFAGFGLEPFVYWRGNGNEIDILPAEYVWEAPDGTGLLVHHLSEGYFNASGLPRDPDAAAQWLAGVVQQLAARTRNGQVLLMNGIDHALPDAHTAAVAERLARVTGHEVRRGLIEHFAAGLRRDPPRFSGELLGGRVANLLPGVWSTRTPFKLRNRRCEMLLEGWAEPWSALGRALGTPDERPALRLAWRAVLQNQAHDSICGCSQDRVHEQMAARYDTAEELARETTARTLERLAGLGAERRTPWREAVEVAVFNPSPHARTDVVRLPLDPSSWFETRGETSREFGVHPLLAATAAAHGYTVDGQPARLVTEAGAPRVWLLPDCPPKALEFVARDVPAFGSRRLTLRPATPMPDVEDDGREIAAGRVAVAVDADGTLSVRLGERRFRGLAAVEDVGDRGDTYDFDAAPGGACELQSVRVQRRVHPSGLQSVTVERAFLVPRAIDAGRERRSDERVPLTIEVEARVAPGVERVDLCVRVHNTACDHRLRLLFPTGAPVEEFHAAATFDVVRRTTHRPDDARWIHPAPATFPHQGFVSANGLTVAAPGLPEAEVTPEGVIAVTVVRAVGWLARFDLRSRPQLAGPSVPTPGAQCLQTVDARLALLPGLDTRAARDAELGLWAVIAGDAPLLPPGRSLLAVEPRDVLVSALLPAEEGSGMVLRLLNPTDAARAARVTLGFPVVRALAVRLDETPGADPPLTLRGPTLELQLPPHALRSVLLTPAS
jgi:alpha-mannosidase